MNKFWNLLFLLLDFSISFPILVLSAAYEEARAVWEWYNEEFWQEVER